MVWRKPSGGNKRNRPQETISLIRPAFVRPRPGTCISVIPSAVMPGRPCSRLGEESPVHEGHRATTRKVGCSDRVDPVVGEYDIDQPPHFVAQFV